MDTESVTQQQVAPQKPKSRRAKLFWLLTAALLLGGGFLYSQRPAGSNSGSSSAGSKSGKGSRSGRGAGGGPIPVSITTVQKGNMGVYISALGTVTSVYTVALTSRVTGSLIEIRYREGQRVKKGDLLAVIDPRPYQATYLQAEGQLERDQALLANARIDLSRYGAALSKNAIPEQTFATQQAVVNQDQGTVKVDQGNLDAAKVNVEYTQIRAPIDGRVGLRAVDPGNIVQANGTTPILTITQLQPITVIFTMAEDYISEVLKQTSAGRKLRVDALSRDNQTELAQGELLTIDNLVDTTTGTVRARATFKNSDYKLFPNEFVNTKLLVRTLMGVNIVSNAAIQRNGDVSFVYAVDANQTVHSRNVTVATTDGNRSAVTGVSPGETVVTDGFDKLQDGEKVSPRPGGRGAPGSPTANQAKEADENNQPSTQGDANVRLNTAQQNPQQPAQSQHK